MAVTFIRICNRLREFSGKGGVVVSRMEVGGEDIA